jgi:hypothetical protein
MNTQEYLGIISILKQARDLVNAVVDDLSDRSSAASDLRRVVADLERAIAAYQDKLKASRTLEVPAKRGPYQTNRNFSIPGGMSGGRLCSRSGR